MHSSHTSKNLYWLIFLEMVAFIYLLFELSFNARLLTAVGNIPDLDQIHGLELAGRTISGIGAVLIAWRLIGFKTENVKKSIIVLAVSFALIVPAVYVGQSLLVGSVVKSASQEQKRAAFLAALAWQNVSTGALEFSLLSTGAEPVRDATFYATFGIFLMNDSEILQELEDKFEDIAARATYQKAGGDNMWVQYQEAHDKINQHLQSYKDGSNEIAIAKTQGRDKAEEAWNMVQAEIGKAWRIIDSNREKIFNRNEDVAAYAKKQLVPLFDELAACGGACRDRVERKYNQELQQYFGHTVPMDWWCNGWDGHGAPPRYHPGAPNSCPGRTSTIVQAVNVLSEQKFKKQTGFPLSVTYSDFLVSEKLKSTVLGQLKSRRINTEGLEFPLTKTQFMEVVSRGIGAQADKDFSTKTKTLLGVELEPGLDEKMLLERADIRAALEDKYGLAADMPLGLSRSEFEETVMMPVLQKHIEEIKEKAFSDRYVEQHEDALRALIVPPIALIFSLFFSILNAGSLVVSSAAIFSTSVERFKPAIITAMIFFIVAGPFALPAPGKNNPMYSTSLEVLGGESPVIAFGVDWLNRFEPYVMPIGETIRTNILGGITYGYHTDET